MILRGAAIDSHAPAAVTPSIWPTEDLTEFDRPVTLEELRANGVRFARNIVSGRGLNLDETATVLELGGLGVGLRRDVAADAHRRYGAAES